MLVFKTDKSASVVKSQTQGRIGGTSIGFSHEGDHLSPGSVLEASFLS